VRCPIQVDDLAAAILDLAVTSYVGVLHLAGPQALSRREFAELVVGRQVRGTNAPPDRPLDCRLDITQARALLSFNPRSVSQVFRRTVHKVSDTL
jgi:dTDP-4-dehydrorhamnose reductase